MKSYVLIKFAWPCYFMVCNFFLCFKKFVTF